MLEETDLKIELGKLVKKMYLQQNLRSSLIQLLPQEAADLTKDGFSRLLFVVYTELTRVRCSSLILKYFQTM